VIKQRREYNRRPEVKERRRMYKARLEVKERKRRYNQRPEIKERTRKYNQEYRQKPENIERRRKYHQQPEVKKKMNEYMKKYYQRPEIKEKYQKYGQRPEVKERKRKYQETEVQRYCKSCGKSFLTRKHTHAKFCSLQCVWKNEEFIANMRKSRALKPNGQEKELNKILQKLHPKEYKFVGDFAFWIDGKNPDFVSVGGQKKLIELFGTYWHSQEITGRTRVEEERRRKKHFAKFGWKTLIVWEQELKDVEALEKKIVGFHDDGRPEFFEVVK